MKKSILLCGLIALFSCSALYAQDTYFELSAHYAPGISYRSAHHGQDAAVVSESRGNAFSAGIGCKWKTNDWFTFCTGLDYVKASDHIVTPWIANDPKTNNTYSYNVDGTLDYRLISIPIVTNFRFLNTSWGEFYVLAGTQFQVILDIKEELHDSHQTLDKEDVWQKDYGAFFTNHTYRHVPTAGLGMRSRLSEHITFAAEVAYQRQFAYDFSIGPLSFQRPDLYNFSTIGLNLQLGYRF